MKHLLFLTGLFALMLMGYTHIQTYRLARPDNRKAYHMARQKISNSSFRCSPNWIENPVNEESIREMILLPGTGSHSWKITTTSDSAQLYFNQGINLYYGFHIIEAMPSFKKALRFDSAAAMLYWAVALAYGPNINDMGYTPSPDALLAVSKATHYSNQATLKERELIDAMNAHYSTDSTVARTALNQLYAEKMKVLYLKYPKDAEIGSLYADALMNLHPWDFWKPDGRPELWTPELMDVLEKTIRVDPKHPGANHYYIHTMEASPYAAKANASADKLQSLTPGLAHMVHMPSHIYIRTGEYNKGRTVNEAAVKTYEEYKVLYPEVFSGAFLYQYHNLHMQAASSMNMNAYPAAIQDAMDCRRSIDTSYFLTDASFGNYVQYMYMTPMLTWITFEKWNEILQQPLISHEYHYGRLLLEFGRGMAFANTGQLDRAKFSLAIMDSILLEKDMAVVLQPFNAAVTGGTVAKYILLGTVAEKENKVSDALKYYEKGVTMEDSLLYQEPRDWLIPVRHYLGNLLLKEKKYEEAKKVFEEDIVYQPKNYISTLGLSKINSRR